MRCTLAISIFLFSVFSIGAQTYHVNTKSIWEKGKEAEENGHYKRALQIWQTVNSDTVNHGYSISDARIGFSYIRLATEQKMTAYYKEASAMYFWSLTQGCNASNKAALSEELERVSPVIPEQNYKKWEKDLDGDITAFCKGLVSFWKTVDPTLSSVYNERLLEHWQRIAYSKKHFKRSNNTVYGTDDRGLIYVRLGKPDVIKSGTMHFSIGLAKSWALDILDAHSHTSTSERGGMPRNLSRSQSLANGAYRVHKYPDYEIWVYRGLSSHRYNNMVYIFGQDGDYHTFGLRKSLDEMITSSKRIGTMLKILLQLAYYEQVASVDPFFDGRYQNLLGRAMSMAGINRRTASIFEHQSESALTFMHSSAPTQKPSITENISAIPLQSYQYRFLDKNNTPYLATFVESRPQEAVYLDQIKEKKFSVSNYRLINNIILAPGDSSIVEKKSRNTAIHLNEKGNTKDMKAFGTYFKIPNISKGIDQIFTAELYNTDKDSNRVSKNIFTENVRAVGKTKLQQPEPLSTDTKKLEISDILVGINEKDTSQSQEGPAGFNVINNKEIPEDKNLMIYFQVYHLHSQAPDPNKFQIEYKLLRKEKNIFKKIFGSEEKVGLTLNFETFDTYYTNNLEIDTSAFGPGDYLLTLTVKEAATNRETEREVQFKIKEK